MKTSQIEADFLYCENIIRKHSVRFYRAFSRLPHEKSNAVYAIYAFCRMADDCVDENTSSIDKQRELNQLHSELDLFSKKQELDLPLWRALRHVFNQYEMDLQLFYDQLKGQRMDINFTPPKTMLELEKYSYYVAGSVGLMLLPIIASESWRTLKQPAIDLGIAMQITNILRDIGEDFQEKKRIYLPEMELRRYQYYVEDLNAGIINKSFISLWESLASRAEELYENFYTHVRKFDRDSQVPVYLSALAYRRILNSVRKNDYDCLSKRNYIVKE
ncbi:MAG: phytoene/squalene synthase family protein [Bacillus sp. (in: firmicutes)]